MEYEKRVTEVTVKPVEEQMFSINATVIRVASEGGGEFVTLTQETEDGERIIAVEKDDWFLIRGVVDEMMMSLEESDDRLHQD